MSDGLLKVGPSWGGSGTFTPPTADISGAQRVQDAHGRYLDAVLTGRVFRLSAAAAGPTAYTGAAAGTPLLAVHNPANSGKTLAIIGAGFAGRASGSGAGQSGLAFWTGPSVLPTGTTTVPTSALSGALSGSAALGFVNTALTNSTALALALPLATYYWATAAGAFMASGWFDVGGLLVVPPGNQVALGVTTVPLSWTVDVSLLWEELPYLTTA